MQLYMNKHAVYSQIHGSIEWGAFGIIGLYQTVTRNRCDKIRIPHFPTKNLGDQVTTLQTLSRRKVKAAHTPHTHIRTPTTASSFKVINVESYTATLSLQQILKSPLQTRADYRHLFGESVGR